MNVMALLTRSVADANKTRRLVRIWSSKVSNLSLDIACPDTEASVVDSVPISRRRVRLTVALPVPAIPLTKKVAEKGKTVPHHVTQPWARKVTQVVSTSPDMVRVSGPNPPIAGPSVVMQQPLFEEPLQSGGEEVRPVTQESSGEWDQSHLSWYSTKPCVPVFGTPTLLKCKVDKIAANAPPPHRANL